MRCEAVVEVRDYSKPGRCAMTRGVQNVGEKPFKSKLCSPHRKVLARFGSIKLYVDKKRA